MKQQASASSPNDGDAATARGERRLRRPILLAVAILAAISGGLVVQRVAIFTWIGSLLVVEDPLSRADAILPLAGGTFDREIEAAELFRQGYAPRVLLTRGPDTIARLHLARLGVHLPTDEEERMGILAALGVPRDRVIALKGTVTSTFDEARALDAWAGEAGARRIIIVTSPFHTARARYVFERYAGNGRVTLLMRPSKLSGFTADTWWTQRSMLREGIIELQKTAIYRLWY